MALEGLSGYSEAHPPWNETSAEKTRQQASDFEVSSDLSAQRGSGGMMLRLTNGQVADLIDGLQTAIDNNRALLDSNMPPSSVARKAWSQEDKDLFNEWTAQIRRWRKLRKLLLAHERAA